MPTLNPYVKQTWHNEPLTDTPVSADRMIHLEGQYDAAMADAAALYGKDVHPWAPSTAYAAGQAVLSPSGDVVTAKSPHTSSASFSGTGTTGNWALTQSFTPKSYAAVNVKDKGAIGDGVADDTAAIQAAINSAATFGARVYLPDGTYLVKQPTGLDYMLEAKARMRIYGEGTIKVSSTAGNFRALLTGVAASTDLSGLTVEGITFDMNNTGNPVSDASTGGPLFNGYPRYAIYVGVGSGISVRRSTFKDTDSINTVAINGTGVSDVSIQDNLFTGVGTSPGYHDHSTVYVSSDGMTITGNRFLGTAGGKGSTTAIETHGSGQVVAHNRVRDYYTGANITGVAANGSDGITVADNVFRNVNNGIALWSLASGTGLRYCTVHDNLITINHDAWIRGTTDYPRGISLDPGVNVDITNLSIHHNTIVFRTVTVAAQSGELQAAGIALWTNSATPKLNNLRVDSNTITGSLSVGIRLQATINGGRVQDNDITDPGSSADSGMASFYKAGLAIVGTVNDLMIENNRTFDSRGTHVVTTGISTSITAATRSRSRRNRVSCADGASLQPFTATAGAGKSFFVDEEMDTYAAPGSCRIGSRMLDLATGNTYVQTASPEGTTWAVRAL